MRKEVTLKKYIPLLPEKHKNFRFDRKSQQLKHILEDRNYWPEQNNITGYKKFISDMYKAIVNGRKITPKMEVAINGAVQRYVESSAPNPERERRINKILEILEEAKSEVLLANYSQRYADGAIYFIKNLARSAERYGQLTNKQKLAVNRIYKKAKKRRETYNV
tara:strand:- start:204 stop:695 length:492 start_codon:yes stop_codon:yes gene_type:complete